MPKKHKLSKRAILNEDMGLGIEDLPGDYWEKAPMFFDHEMPDYEDEKSEGAAKKLIQKDPEQFFYQGLHKEYPDLEHEALEKVIKDNPKFYFVFKYSDREEFEDLLLPAAESLAQEDPRAFFYYSLHQQFPELGRGAIVQLIDRDPRSFGQLGLDKDYPDYSQSATDAINIYDPVKVDTREKEAHISSRAAREDLITRDELNKVYELEYKLSELNKREELGDNAYLLKNKYSTELNMLLDKLLDQLRYTFDYWVSEHGDCKMEPRWEEELGRARERVAKMNDELQSSYPKSLQEKIILFNRAIGTLHMNGPMLDRAVDDIGIWEGSQLLKDLTDGMGVDEWKQQIDRISKRDHVMSKRATGEDLYGWMNRKTGEVHKIGTKLHYQAVKENPEIFGLHEKDVADVTLGSFDKIRSRVMNDWIRVSYSAPVAIAQTNNITDKDIKLLQDYFMDNNLFPGARVDIEDSASNIHKRMRYGDFLGLNSANDFRKMDMFLSKSAKVDVDLTPEEQQVFDFVKEAISYFKLNTTARVAGGWVRDKLMGRPSKDIDIAVDNMMGQKFAGYLKQYAQLQNVPVKTGLIPAKPEQGKNLETAIVNIMDEEIEIVNLRDEEYTPGSRHPETILTNSPTKDAFRRDFTINSLFYNINTGEVEDFTGTGVDDIKNGVVRTPEVSSENVDEVGRDITAKQTFLDDPLRIMRAIRFANRYGFEIDPSVAEAAKDPEVQKAFRQMITPERVEIEMRKIMGENKSPRYALELIRDWGLRDEVLGLPEGYDKWEMDQNNPHHELNLWDHLMEALDNIQEIIREKDLGSVDRYILNWATLLHDVGKLNPSIKGTKELEGKLVNTYYGHEESSMEAAEYLLRNLKGTTVKEIDRIKTLIDAARRMNPDHTDPEQVSNMKRKALGKILRLTSAFENDWERAMEVAMADASAHQKGWIQQYPRQYWDTLTEQFKAMPKETSTMGPLLNGKEVMDLFERKGGPWLGRVNTAMVEWQMENPEATKQDAIQWAKEYYISNGMDKMASISKRVAGTRPIIPLDATPITLQDPEDIKRRQEEYEREHERKRLERVQEELGSEFDYSQHQMDPEFDKQVDVRFPEKISSSNTIRFFLMKHYLRDKYRPYALGMLNGLFVVQPSKYFDLMLFNDEMFAQEINRAMLHTAVLEPEYFMRWVYPNFEGAEGYKILAERSLKEGLSPGERRNKLLKGSSVSKRDDKVSGGRADKMDPDSFDKDQLDKGVRVELEHTDDPDLALEIAMDHLTELPDYYDRLEKMEKSAISKRAGKIDYPQKMYEDIMEWVMEIKSQRPWWKRVFEGYEPISKVFRIDISDTEQYKKHDWLAKSLNLEQSNGFHKWVEVFLYPGDAMGYSGTHSIEEGRHEMRIYDFMALAKKDELGVTIKHELIHLMQFLMSDTIYSKEVFEGKGDQSRYRGRAGLPSYYDQETYQMYGKENDNKKEESQHKKHSLSDIEFYALLNDQVELVKKTLSNLKAKNIDVSFQDVIRKLTEYSSFLTYLQKDQPEKYQKAIREIYKAFDEISKAAGHRLSKRTAEEYKGYFERRYPYSVRVLVMYPDMEPFEDEIKGLNAGHALYSAKWNWPGAEIKLLGPDDDDMDVNGNRDGLISKRAKNEKHAGVFIKLPPALAKQFPSLGDHDSSPSHITVLYIGVVPEKKNSLLEETVKGVIEKHLPFKLTLDDKPSYFPASKSSDGCKVAKMKIISDELHKLHKELKEAVSEAGIEVADKWPSYNPHTTLEYMSPPKKKWDGPVPVGSWVPASVEIWGCGKPRVIKFPRHLSKRAGVNRMSKRQYSDKELLLRWEDGKIYGPEFSCIIKEASDKGIDIGQLLEYKVVNKGQDKEK